MAGEGNEDVILEGTAHSSGVSERQDPLEIPVGEQSKEDSMAAGDGLAGPTPQLAEPGNLAVAMSVLAQGAAGAADARMRAADQLGSDSQRMWSIAMTTPTVLAGLGYRAATESGSGRTRAETNNPANTGAAGNT